MSLVYQGGQTGARMVVPYLILADPVAAEQGSELQRSCSKSCPTFWGSLLVCLVTSVAQSKVWMLLLSVSPTKAALLLCLTR